MSANTATVMPAGFWRRLLAYLIDVLPIVLLVTLASYLFFGFDERWATYRKYPQNVQVRVHFYEIRSWIRVSAFLLWLAYSIIMEASSLQGTYGKGALGLRVVGPTGERLTLARSLGRNCAKLLSYYASGIGFLWAAFSKEIRAWHDLLAKTSVVVDKVDFTSGRWLRDSGGPSHERSLS